MACKKSIIEFWHKFAALSKQLANLPEDKSLIATLDKNVKDLLGTEFDWEFGPAGGKEEFYFCISPNFQRDLLNVTKEIISYAPQLENWIFLSTKPPKEWSRELKILDHQDQVIIVKPENWRAAIYKFEDGIYEIDIKMDNMDRKSEVANLAKDIILTNVLGEKKYMDLVETVNLVDEFDKYVKNEGILVKDLDKYII